MPTTTTAGTLENRSPSLAGALRRSGFVSSAFDEAFRYALEHGGEHERGFKRPVGQSFNPRPARVAQILLKDFALTERGVDVGTILSAAMIACSDCPQDFHNPVIRDLALVSLGDSWERDLSAALIAHALHLDRARHLHLTSVVEFGFRAETERHMANCRIVAPRSMPLFEKIIERISRAPRRDL